MVVRRRLLGAALLAAALAAAGSSGVAARDVRDVGAGPTRASLEPTSGPSGTFDPGTAAALQDVLVQARARLNLAGLSAAIVMPDGSRWEGVLGDAKVDPDPRLVSPSTPFDIGSITKTFVAALVLRLAERGVLSLDDHLSRWMPHWPRAAHITIRQLLQHRAGQMDYFNSPSFIPLVFGDLQHHWTVPEILDLVGPPLYRPGTGYLYSNTDFILLGTVIKRATGKELSRLIRSEFLDPLQLHDTYFQGEEPLPPDAAYGYLRYDHRWIGQSDGSRYRPNCSVATVAWAAGGMMSTANDLATWAHALYGGHVLQPNSLASMLTFVSHDATRNIDYGLGAERRYQDGRLEWGHGGSLRGFEAGMWYLPARDASVAILSNRGLVKVKSVTRELMRVLVAHWPAATGATRPPGATDRVAPAYPA